MMTATPGNEVLSIGKYRIRYGLLTGNHHHPPIHMKIGSITTSSIQRGMPIPDRAVRIAVHGTVQGIGFRPAMHRWAHELNLTGSVRNSPYGADIWIQGKADAVQALLDRLATAPPAQARIDRMEIADMPPDSNQCSFRIEISGNEAAPTASMTPDLATCPDCLRELRDPADRRYRYPFLNCTQCGPRYSIQRSIPYDRANTSMDSFTMCSACQAEYDDPTHRRFHAQPNACRDCGPALQLLNPAGHTLHAGDQALDQARTLLEQGKILAVKGLGGFHLMADALNAEAIALLRTRKHREEKPFAVMMPDLATTRRHTRINATEEALLTSAAAPIVLLAKRSAPSAPPVADSVAPGQPSLGCMLPYTPLHHLLLQDWDHPVVATSANLSDEPICIRTREVIDRLGGVVDAILTHDRPIVRPVDDSVLRVAGGERMMMRRSRGFAPTPVTTRAPRLDLSMLAVGGQLKNTAGLLHRGSMILSQHLGDLETVAAQFAFEEAVSLLLGLYRTDPAIVVCDQHPDYLSTQYARSRPGVEVIEVQHHVAHIAAGMAEHHLMHKVFGLAWDGTGYGDDGTAWGSECMVVDQRAVQRVACLKPFLLPGGEAAIRDPRRAAIGLLISSLGSDLALSQLQAMDRLGFSEADLLNLWKHIHHGKPSPLVSGMGRLFDVIAVLSGLADHASFEGQAAMRVEAALEASWANEPPYPLPLIACPESAPNFWIDPAPLVLAVIEDRMRDVSPALISARFHQALIHLIPRLLAEVDLPDIVLSGGCFQNLALREGAARIIVSSGRTPRCHREIPANDGGLAAGQLWYAAWGSC